MMVWLRAFGLPLIIATTFGFENTRGKSKIELYTCAWRPVVRGKVTRSERAKRSPENQISIATYTPSLAS